jgi:hypothetical protein
VSGNERLLEARRRRRRNRRRLAAYLAPLAVVLIVVGSLLADEGGAAEAIGLVALAQGIGLAVALAWLAAGRNPLSRE